MGRSKARVLADLFSQKTEITFDSVAETPDVIYTLDGDVQGSAVQSVGGSVTIQTTVVDDSHNHNGTYYTKTEVDNFVSTRSETTSVDDNDYLLILDGATAQQKKIQATKVGGGKWVTTGTNYTASAGDKLFADCNGSAATVNLPASPAVGHEVLVVDVAGKAGTYTIIVNGNGHNVMGDNQLVIDMDNASVRFAYSGTTYGWRII